MLNFHLSYKWLHWRAPASDRDPLPSPLPDGIQRFYIQPPSSSSSPTRKIEILYAKPQNVNDTTTIHKKRPPIFFTHGGMGCAAVWLEYMTFLSARGIPCYAVSLRGHGNSWYPSFVRMVYGTTKRMLADDVVAGIRWAQAREQGEEVLLVGHSSGGGLSQLVLSEGDVKVKGLVLAGAVPGFGSTGVYLNWFRLDPWFTIRMLLHGWHPNSPLSHPALIRRVFFSDAQTDAYVERFQSLVNHYESFLWPLGMGYRFVDPLSVLRHISGWGTAGGARVLVLAGGGDKIMTHGVMQKLAAWYRKAHEVLVGQKKIDSGDGEGQVQAVDGEGSLDTVGQGVQLAVVPGAGHHMQNDVQWEVGARKLLAFYEQL